MRTYVFDCETNAIDFASLRPWQSARRIHTLVIQDANSEELYQYRHNDKENTIEEGLARLDEADVIVAHNGCLFDIPVLNHLYGWTPKAAIEDTLIMSRMVYSNDLRWMDSRKVKEGSLVIPPRLVGRHSLDAWGYRLGYEGKMEWGGELADKWEKWTQDMEDYCVTDVAITTSLYKRFLAKNVAGGKASLMEAALAPHLALTTAHGWRFNERAAHKLTAELSAQREKARVVLVKRFGYHWVANGPKKVAKKTLKYKDPKRGDLTAGCEYQPVKRVLFNPASTDHIAYELQRRFNWVPTEFTDNGKVKVDEASLKGLPFEPMPDIIRFLMLNKRLSQISEGKQAWLKVVKDGRIHGKYNQFGTRTGRMSHEKPNIGQVPRVGSDYGLECRQLFMASQGLVAVGGDASGIELRLLGHYAFPFDNGQLAEVVLQGDVHKENQTAVGLVLRDTAKTFIYAMLYGAGDEKLGRIIASERDEKWDTKKLKAAGKRGRRAIEARFPGYAGLLKAVRAKAKKSGTLKAIDGRTLRHVSEHNALNTLLQGAGGVLMKAALPMLADVLDADENLKLHRDVHVLGHIHDEIQVECRRDVADVVGDCIVRAIGLTGKKYGLRVPLDGEYKIGTTWADTH